MTSAGPAPGPLTRAFVGWTLRYGRWIWLVALLLGIPATWRTAQLYLNLKSDLEELLPRDAPSVHAVEELRARAPGLQYLGVVVDTGDASRLPRGERFIDDLAARIRTYPPKLARSVRTGTAEERAFLESHSVLYVDLPDLQTIRERIEARRDYEVARETGSTLDEDLPPPSLDFGDLEAKYDAKLPKRGKTEGDRYSSQELHLTMLLVEVGGFETGTADAKRLLSRVKDDIAALGGTDAYAHGMRVGYSGDVAISVEELESLIEDLSISSVIVIVAVAVAIVVFYRWRRSVLVLVPPLLLATVYAFALASLPPFDVTALNSNTAFLGSIIVGNGINFGIILLARYTEERKRGEGRDEALATAAWSARLGTLSAALGASVSYVSLISTQFRGFRQFGIIGGLGMVLSWAVTFVCMPPLIAWLDRGGRATIAHRTGRTDSPFLVGALARMVNRHRMLVFGVGAVVTLLAVAKASTFGIDQLEYDVSNLRRHDTWTKGEGYWGHRMDDLLGRYLTPTVLLADSREQARALGKRVEEEAKRGPLSRMVSEVITLDDVHPPRAPRRKACGGARHSRRPDAEDPLAHRARKAVGARPPPRRSRAGAHHACPAPTELHEGPPRA